MDRFETAFCVLSQRMGALPMPGCRAPAPQSLTSLIDKVNAAKRLYQPGVRR